MSLEPLMRKAFSGVGGKYGSKEVKKKARLHLMMRKKYTSPVIAHLSASGMEMDRRRRSDRRTFRVGQGSSSDAGAIGAWIDGRHARNASGTTTGAIDRM